MPRPVLVEAAALEAVLGQVLAGAEAMGEALVRVELILPPEDGMAQLIMTLMGAPTA